MSLLVLFASLYVKGIWKPYSKRSESCRPIDIDLSTKHAFMKLLNSQHGKKFFLLTSNSSYGPYQQSRRKGQRSSRSKGPCDQDLVCPRSQSSFRTLKDISSTTTQGPEMTYIVNTIPPLSESRPSRARAPDQKVRGPSLMKISRAQFKLLSYVRRSKLCILVLMTSSGIVVYL